MVGVLNWNFWSPNWNWWVSSIGNGGVLIECVGKRGSKLKLVDAIRKCRSVVVRASLARVLTVGLLLFPVSIAQAAVETYQEGVSSYSSTWDTFLEEENPNTSRENHSLVKLENDPTQTTHHYRRDAPSGFYALWVQPLHNSLNPSILP